MPIIDVAVLRTIYLSSSNFVQPQLMRGELRLKPQTRYPMLSFCVVWSCIIALSFRITKLRWLSLVSLTSLDKELNLR